MAQAGKFERLRINLQEWALGRLDRLRLRPSRTSRPVPHLDTGLRGERAVLFELRRRGVVVVAQRWTSPHMQGDIDLIGWDGDNLCFIEVKTRTERDLRPAEAAIDEHKRQMARCLATAYLRGFPEPERVTIPVRFDVVSVYANGRIAEFDFFKAAFGWR